MSRVDCHAQSACQIHQVIHGRADIQEFDGNEQIRANNQDESKPANLLNMFISH